MTTIYVTVGLPASGKSTWANANADKLNALILSSDGWRKEHFGGEEVQGNNQEIFDALHKELFRLLSEGQSVIFDSTALQAKHRISLLQKLSKLNIHKTAVLFATDFDKCVNRNNLRERTVPEDVMDRYYKTITIPQFSEGWDEIHVEWSYNPCDYNFTSLFDQLDGFEQDNPHHTKTVGCHCRTTANILNEWMTLSKEVYLAGWLHDIGKLKTKVFTNMKGEPTEHAHFYGHDSVSAYDSLFYLKQLGWSDESIIYTCGLIQYHMRPHGIKTEKAQKKFLDLVGEKMYNEVMLLHNADKGAK